MAKKGNAILIRMVSTADTGYFVVCKKNPKQTPDKFKMRKYDPRVRKHVMFEEKKIK